MQQALVLPITALFAGILAIVQVAYAVRVSVYRNKTKTNLGDGGKDTMLRASRVHGNFTEYVPIALVLLGLIEINSGPAWLLYTLGAVLLAARLIHPFGIFPKDVFPARLIGQGGTWLVLLVGGVYAVAQAVAA